ncbi:hypothetical protein [uncultured Methanobrevibacter sp.]|uniref:hypothetical protein n=1 Tax=uncultured Methanobrevibacter sp. TaxID=253161 RepID=UPI002615E07F
MGEDKDFKQYVSLSINGIDIELNAFTDEFLKETILGMLRAIKTDKYGVKEFKDIKITVDNNE